jgi:hypothetical protein
MKSFKEFLTEALIDVDASDINLIYAPMAKPMRELAEVWKRHFKDLTSSDLDLRNLAQTRLQRELNEVRKKYQPVFGPLKVIDSSKLKSENAKKAHAINPVKINVYLIGTPSMSNSYNVQHKEINICLPYGVAEAMMDRINTVPQYQLPMLQNEVSMLKHKTTIRHELTHWIDDSLHNLYLTKALFRAHELVKVDKEGAVKYYNDAVKHGFDDIYLSPVEVTPMVNQIAELKRRLGNKKYDNLTWAQVMILLPSLDSLNRKHGAAWRKIMFTRLARENLIGKKFRDQLS